MRLTKTSSACSRGTFVNGVFAEVFWLPDSSGYSGGTAPASHRLALDEDAPVIAVL